MKEPNLAVNSEFSETALPEMQMGYVSRKGLNYVSAYRA